MRFCHQCGHHLSLGSEKYCPECGAALVPVPSGTTTDNRGNDYYSSTDIIGTSGDVFGSGVRGTGHIIGKEVRYTINRNIINLHVDSLSVETLEDFRRVISTSTHIDSSIVSDNNVNKTEKVREATINKQQISQILKEVNRIGEEKGTEIKGIRAGELQISSNELALRQLILKGNKHYYKDEYSEAIQAYDEAIQIDPNYVNAWNNKGNALGHLGRYEEAIEAYDKVIQIDPNYALAWNNKGIALGKLGKYNEAIEAYDRAIQIDPNYVNAWYNKGNVLDNLGKYNEAIEAYDKAIQIDPNYALAWNNKGTALDDLEKYEEAIQAYDKVIQIDPNYVNAWYNKGLALKNLGKDKDANKCFDKSRQLTEK